MGFWAGGRRVAKHSNALLRARARGTELRVTYTVYGRAGSVSRLRAATGGAWDRPWRLGRVRVWRGDHGVDLELGWRCVGYREEKRIGFITTAMHRAD